MGESHLKISNGFSSRNGELNLFLAKDALEYQKLNLGVTYLLLSEDKRLISYITLGMGALKIPDIANFEFHGRKLREYPKEFPNQFPALLIGKIATEQSQENMGGATSLLKFALKLANELRDKVGCAYLVAHVYPQSIDWYRQKGFKTYVGNIAERETIPMYLELS